jgi:hypothetical protein
LQESANEKFCKKSDKLAYLHAVTHSHTRHDAWSKFRSILLDNFSLFLLKLESNNAGFFLSLNTVVTGATDGIGKEYARKVSEWKIVSKVGSVWMQAGSY